MAKKTFILLVVICSLAIMAYGTIGTGAWFTDQATLDNNYVVTGNLDIAITGTALTATNLQPGADYTTMGTFCVENRGSIDSKWYAYMQPTRNDNNLASKLLVKVTLNPAGSTHSYGPSEKELFAGTPFMALTDSTNPVMVMNDKDWPFGVGDANIACYQVDVKVAKDAPNSMQNSTVVANLVLNATQYISDGWTQLPVHTTP